MYAFQIFHLIPKRLYQTPNEKAFSSSDGDCMLAVSPLFQVNLSLCKSLRAGSTVGRGNAMKSCEMRHCVTISCSSLMSRDPVDVLSTIPELHLLSEYPRIILGWRMVYNTLSFLSIFTSWNHPWVSVNSLPHHHPLQVSQDPLASLPSQPPNPTPIQVAQDF